MTSPLIDAKDQLATALAALTPPTTTSRTYRHITVNGEVTGASSHRGFYFGIPSGGTKDGQSGSLTVRIYDWNVILILGTSEYDLDSLFEACVNEAELFLTEIDTQASWPAGVRMVETGDFSISRDGDYVQITIDLKSAIEVT